MPVHVNLENMTMEERLMLVCLYFSKLDDDDPRYKDMRQWFMTMAEATGRTYKVFDTYKDAFDETYNSERRGDRLPENFHADTFNAVKDRYGDVPADGLEQPAREIVTELSGRSAGFITCRIQKPDVVKAFLKRPDLDFVMDGVYTLRDELTDGKIIFIALGGDKGKAEVTWETGLYAVGHVSWPPYDIGYEKSQKSDYFRFRIQPDFILPRPISKEELRIYPDTFDAPYIGVEIKRAPTQAICQLPYEKAVAATRAMIEIFPDAKDMISQVFNASFMEKVLGPVRKSIDVKVEYGKKPELPPMEDSTAGTEEYSPDSGSGYFPYTEERFLNEVYVTEDDYKRLTNLLYAKRNLILQGPPGTGKTFMARRLAYAMMGRVANDNVKLIQFHPSYSYEDFVIGYRPVENGFELKHGPFYEFCRKAESRPKEKFFLIIDEINRGDVSKIFGELLMAIEKDKRSMTVDLLYSDEPFSVPENLFIIGMMNTADRSIAMIDYALRRRFAFFDVKPAFDSEKFIKNHVMRGASNSFEKVVKVIKELNEYIAQDPSLGPGFEIGHSYFCLGRDWDFVDTEDLEEVIENEIIPLLHEYWFDDPSTLTNWINRLVDCVKHA